MNGIDEIKLEKKNVNDALRQMVTARDFGEAVNSLAKAGAVKELIEVYSKAGRSEKVKIGEALVTAVEACAEKGKSFEIELLDIHLHFPKETGTRLATALSKVIETRGDKGDLWFVANLLGRKNVPPEARASVEPALIRALEVSAAKGDANIYALCELWERKDISEDVGRAIGPALIAAIESYGKHGSRHGISYVLGQDSLPEEVALKAIEVATKKEWFAVLRNLLKGEPLGKLEGGKPYGRDKLSEAPIAHILEIGLKTNHWYFADYALAREEFSEERKIRLVERLGRNGFADPIADFLDDNLYPSAPLKEAAENALIKALENYGKRNTNGWPHRIRRLLELREQSGLPAEITDAVEPALLMLLEKIDTSEDNVLTVIRLLEHDGLPNSVRAGMEAKVIGGLEMFGSFEYTGVTQLFVGRDSLSPPVRDAVERTHKRCNPAAVIGCYLEQRSEQRRPLEKAQRFFGIGRKPPGHPSVRAGSDMKGALVPPGRLKKQSPKMVKI